MNNEANMPSETFFAFKYEKEIYKSSAMTDPFFTYLVKERCNLSPFAKNTAINSLIPKKIFLEANSTSHCCG